MKFLIKNEINLCHREGMFRRNNLSIIQKYSKKKTCMSLEVLKNLRIDLIATIHLVEKNIRVLIFTICYVTSIVVSNSPVTRSCRRLDPCTRKLTRSLNERRRVPEICALFTGHI